MQSEKQNDATDPAAAGAPETSPDGRVGPRKHPRKKVKETVVDHTYRDYSQVKVAPSDDDDDAGAKKNGKSKHVNFPVRLHEIVSNPNYQHIVCWMPHGRAWKIVDKYLLTTVIIPKYFSHNKFESFNRSVNGWGFKRLLGEGPDKKAYYHECFLRGRPELAKLMQRLTNPGKRLPDKSGEPDFYEISKKFPLPELAAGPTGARPGAPPALTSPDARQHSRQPPMFASPSPHGNPYMYGYPVPSIPPPGMSPASRNQGTEPPQAYWPSPGSSPHHFPPNPYGYYPYPPMMMMPQGGPQGGYYMMQPYPPHGYPPQFYPHGQLPPGSSPRMSPAANDNSNIVEETKVKLEEPKPAAKAGDGKDTKKPKDSKPAVEEAGAGIKKKDEKQVVPSNETEKETGKSDSPSKSKKSPLKRAAKDEPEDAKAAKQEKVDGKGEKSTERKSPRRSARTANV